MLYMHEKEVSPTYADTTTTANKIYLGYVATNSQASSETEVAICRIDLNSHNKREWADGDEKFDNAWVDRAILAYETLKE